jgi:hypothetical protein
MNKKITHEPNRFSIFKASTLGDGARFDYEGGKTLDECQDLDKYPPGSHIHQTGTPFFYSYALTDDIKNYRM